MFSSKVQNRKVIAEMCVDGTGMEEDPRVCGEPARRGLILLDDGFSWVVVGGCEASEDEEEEV